jgi:hypothetical protein
MPTVPFNIGSRVATIKFVDKRGRSIYIYGFGHIVDAEIPDEEAIGYASERAREENQQAWKVELDENDAENDYVYSTECLLFDEVLFHEVYDDLYKRFLSIKADRYKYWRNKQKEEERKLP